MAKIGGGFGATIGYSRLPGRVSEGSRASFGKSYQQETRRSMAAVIKAYSDYIKALEGVTPEVVQTMLEPTLAKAKYYTPVKTGTLVDSGRLTVKRVSPTQVRGEIKFGGGSELFYAPIVHESVWLNHKAPTRAKFLQAAMEEDYGEFLDRGVAAYLDAGLGGK